MRPAYPFPIVLFAFFPSLISTYNYLIIFEEFIIFCDSNSMDKKGYKVKHFLPIPVPMLPSCPSQRQSILLAFWFCVHECIYPYKITSLNSFHSGLNEMKLNFPLLHACPWVASMCQKGMHNHTDSFVYS